MSKFSIFGEIWSYMRLHKKWWLFPIILFFVLFAFILIFAQASPLGPLIYTIF